MTLQAIEAYGQISLGAMLAGIDTADPARHIPLLKDSIELTIDRVAAAEHSYFDVLAECVLLASQNLQDVRLHDLQRRMERIENPEASPLSEMLIETAIVLAVELVGVMGSAWLVGPALVFVGARLLARSSRVNTIAVKLGAYQYQLRQQLWREWLAAVKKLEEAKRRMNAARAAHDTYHPLPLNVLEGEVYDAARLLAEAERAVQLAQRTSVSDAVDAYKKALTTRSARMKSKPLRDFLSGATGHTVEGRLGESSGQQLSKLLSHTIHSDSGPLRDAPFLSSTVVGEILSRLREAQLEARIGHQFSRVYVRSVADESFATDSMSQEIARAVFDAQVPLEGALALVDVVRPVLVRGFEALLWYEWLSISGSFDQYNGARNLSDPQTEYLYDTFAAPYFKIPEHASQLRFKNPYDLDEMRASVAIFFTAFFDSCRAKVSYGGISDLPVRLEDYLRGLSEAPVLDIPLARGNN